MSFFTVLIYFIVFMGLSIILFLIFRELNCWYWKINRSIELQEETNRLLKIIVDSNDIKVLGTTTQILSSEETSILTQDTESVFFEDKIQIPNVKDYTDNKIVFIDGVEGEFEIDETNKKYLLFEGERYYYFPEQYFTKAVYIMATKNKISKDGLIV